MNYSQTSISVEHSFEKPFKGSNLLKGLTVMDMGSRDYQEVWDIQKKLAIETDQWGN